MNSYSISARVRGGMRANAVFFFYGLRFDLVVGCWEHVIHVSCLKSYIWKKHDVVKMPQ